MSELWGTGEDYSRAWRALGLGACVLGKMVIGVDPSGELVEMEILANDGLELLGYPNEDPPPSGKSVLGE